MKIPLSFVFCLFLLVSTSCSGQYNGKDRINLCEQAAALYKAEKTRKTALEIWEYITENEPDSSYAYGMSLNNLHQHYISKSNFKESQEYFKKIINSNLDDEYLTTWIMEPYTNYRHNACIGMFQLYALKDSFETALSFLTQAKNKYPYKNTSSTSLENKKIQLTTWISRLQFDLGHKEKTEHILIEYGLNSLSPKGDSYITNILSELSSSFSKDEISGIKERLERGVSKMKLNDEGAVVIPYDTVYLYVLTTEIFNEQSFKEIFETSYFIGEIRNMCR